MNLNTIFLFGHRATHGKDTCCDMLEQYLHYDSEKYCRTYFAKLLKSQVCERYNLDFDKMTDNDYKNWCPPWVAPKTHEINISHTDENNFTENKTLIKGVWYDVINWGGGYSGNVVTYKKPRSVRQVLIEEGCKGRDIWPDVWANSVYQEIFRSGAKYGLVSDFRFPNEYDCFETSWNYYNKTNAITHTPKVVKILVHRPDGKFVSDGADDQLPDVDEDYWDYIIYNDSGEDWYNVLKQRVIEVFEKER